VQVHFGTRQRVVPITYKGQELDTCYRIDLIVEDLVVVELKAVEKTCLYTRHRC
jgi:GxxExxY protein